MMNALFDQKTAVEEYVRCERIAAENKGREEGRVEGREEGILETAIECFKKGFSFDLVKEIAKALTFAQLKKAQKLAQQG